MPGGVQRVPNDATLARGYRDRAEELRAFAGEFTSEAARRDLLTVAARWDTMADELERAQR